MAAVTSSGTSMIVPVWLSINGNEKSEVLTYALLDTQSDTTFVLEDTARSLGVKGEEIFLSLSTMTAKNTRIKSNKITNMTVRAFSNDRSTPINIPAAYTRDFIPANKAHIPVSDTVSKWPHLQKYVIFCQPYNPAKLAFSLVITVLRHWPPYKS